MKPLRTIPFPFIPPFSPRGERVWVRGRSFPIAI
jgi:hypothetical protein